jgi:ABC-type enterochelin transport system ATPase subunit
LVYHQEMTHHNGRQNGINHTFYEVLSRNISKLKQVLATHVAITVTRIVAQARFPIRKNDEIQQQQHQQQI